MGKAAFALGALLAGSGPGLARQRVVAGLHGGDGGGQERGEQVDFCGPHVLEEVVHAARAGTFGGGIDEVAGPLLEGFLAAAAGVAVPMPTL